MLTRIIYKIQELFYSAVMRFIDWRLSAWARAEYKENLEKDDE